MKRILNLTGAALLALLTGCESSPTNATKVEAKSDEKAAAKPDAGKATPSAKEPNTPQQNEAAAAAKGERPVTSWHGSAPVDTNAFYAGGADWHIKYAAHSDSANESTPFQVSVMRADSGRMTALAVNTRGNTEGSTSVHTAPGMYYLKIAASTPWTVEVTDLH